jgi:hypothetical protein
MWAVRNAVCIHKKILGLEKYFLFFEENNNSIANSFVIISNTTGFFVGIKIAHWAVSLEQKNNLPLVHSCISYTPGSGRVWYNYTFG